MRYAGTQGLAEMSGATPIRLPLSQRQAAALATLLNHELDGSFPPALDELQAFSDVGWDDRKKLAGIWQEHAPLPAEGLSERVYEALIEVARYGATLAEDE